jgi:hypothetical protein
MTVADLRDLTVAPFPNSATRAQLFSELERLIDDLDKAAVVCELWIDGSFLTQKLDPGDIDLSFAAWINHLETLDPTIQAWILANLNGGYAYSPVLDTYFCARFLREDPRYSADKSAYWGEKWVKDWEDWLKGYVVIKLGETDVGRRLFA